MQRAEAQERKGKVLYVKGVRSKSKKKHREREVWVCVWKIILTLFFPLTVHFSTSFVFQVSFWKRNRQPTVSSKTSCFSPSQLLLLPIVQVLLRDSCDENLINFNKLSWKGGKKNKQTNKQTERNIRNACAAQHCASSVIKIHSADGEHTHGAIKRRLHRFTVHMRSSQLAPINLLTKSSALSVFTHTHTH